MTEKKTVVITGAGGGIGRAISLELTTLKAKIIGQGNDSTELERIKKEGVTIWLKK